MLATVLDVRTLPTPYRLVFFAATALAIAGAVLAIIVLVARVRC